MTHAGFFSGPQWLTNRNIAHDYSGPDSSGQRQDITDLLATGSGSRNAWNAAGGAFASASDLLRFARALQNGTLIDPAWATVIAGGKHPVLPPPNAPATTRTTLVGYGIEERLLDGQRSYGHIGGMAIMTDDSSAPGGASTAITIYPDLDLTAVILSNYFLDSPSIDDILDELDALVTASAA